MTNRNEYLELQMYLRKIRQHPLLKRDEEYQLAKEYQKGDVNAGQKIILSNLRFVAKVSQKYFNTGHSYLEIIQEGNIGLIKALSRFDPDRGVQFVYYAKWWIDASIRQFIKKSLHIGLGTLKHANGLISLDETISEDASDEDRWIDYLTDGFDLESQYSGNEVSQKISSMFQEGLTTLNRREVYIIHERFFSDPPITLVEIGSKLGLTQERVRQIQVNSLKKLKRHIGKQTFHKVTLGDLRLNNKDYMVYRIAGS